MLCSRRMVFWGEGFHFFVAVEAILARGKNPFGPLVFGQKIMALRAHHKTHLVMHLGLVGVTGDANPLGFFNGMNSFAMTIETLNTAALKVDFMTSRFLNVVPVLFIVHVALGTDLMIQRGVMDNGIRSFGDIHPDLMKAI